MGIVEDSNRNKDEMIAKGLIDEETFNRVMASMIEWGWADPMEQEEPALIEQDGFLKYEN